VYGKNYESMYEGSMIGAGINVFAVWNYIITKARGGVVEINPKLLAFTLGGKEEDVEDALKFLQRPDPESRSKLEEGRRIIREGQFQYRVVNWGYYQQIRTEEDRREYNRRKQAEYRKRGKPLAGETAAVKAQANGHLDKDFQPVIATSAVPTPAVKAKAPWEKQPTPS